MLRWYSVYYTKIVKTKTIKFTICRTYLLCMYSCIAPRANGGKQAPRRNIGIYCAKQKAVVNMALISNGWTKLHPFAPVSGMYEYTTLIHFYGGFFAYRQSPVALEK